MGLMVLVLGLKESLSFARAHTKKTYFTLPLFFLAFNSAHLAPISSSTAPHLLLLLLLLLLLFIVFKSWNLGRQCQLILSLLEGHAKRVRTNLEFLEGKDQAADGEMAKLREELTRERELRAAVTVELEEERKAAASAAEEAMAKILWLQNEKAMAEREARQYRAVAEQKQRYDLEVIEHLQWILSRVVRDERISAADVGLGGGGGMEDGSAS